MKSTWDIFMPLIERVVTKEGVEDLAFYRAHDKELYFTPWVYVAACYTLFELIFFSLIFVSAYEGNITHMLVFLGFSITIGIGFNAIKMYLHLRKEAIEIKNLITGEKETHFFRSLMMGRDPSGEVDNGLD